LLVPLDKLWVFAPSLEQRNELIHS
jgi:hypothetical protein